MPSRANKVDRRRGKIAGGRGWVRVGAVEVPFLVKAGGTLSTAVVDAALVGCLLLLWFQEPVMAESP
ncbi:MAG: hypothetical protein ACYC35_20855 [Pirellulales bacterium]